MRAGRRDRGSRRLAQRLTREHAERPFDVVYATPRRRVRDTADIITQALGMSATVAADLRGPDHGAADGRPWEGQRVLVLAHGETIQAAHTLLLGLAPGTCRPLAAARQPWAATRDGELIHQDPPQP